MKKTGRSKLSDTRLLTFLSSCFSQEARAETVAESPARTSPQPRQRLTGWVSGRCAGFVAVAQKKRRLPFAHRRWSMALLHALDDNAFEELAVGFCGQLGFQAIRNPEGSRERGAVDIWLYEVKSGKRMAGVQCLGNGEAAGVDAIQKLAVRMAAEGVENGVAIAPGVFSKEARRFVKGRSIELIDGESLLRKIKSLPVETQQRLLQEARAFLGLS